MVSNHNLHSARVILTDDGSHSLFSDQYNENFHSGFGAITESAHIFINNGLKRVSNNHIRILEVGFGTGLNCLLTLLEISKSNQKVSYDALEPFPVEPSVLLNLNYPLLLGAESAKAYKSIISSNWDVDVAIDDNCKLRKINQKLEDFVPDNTYHLVYFDAFSPEIQPEMWSEANFKKIYDAMFPDGLLLTYSCKGIVKRALKSVGFSITKLAGPPGKREILMAKKI